AQWASFLKRGQSPRRLFSGRSDLRLLRRSKLSLVCWNWGSSIGTSKSGLKRLRGRVLFRLSGPFWMVPIGRTFGGLRARFVIFYVSETRRPFPFFLRLRRSKA